jgi:hypothetical protein
MTAYSRRGILAFLSLSLLTTATSLGHPGHAGHDDHIDAEDAALIAKKVVAAKVAEGKLDSAWLAVSATNPEAVKSGKVIEWLVTFDRPAEVDPKKRRLYVFLKLDGQLSGINFTGR